MSVEPKPTLSYEFLRLKHPSIEYRAYHHKLTDDGLVITFSFHLEPDVDFAPTILIKGVTADQLTNVPRAELDFYCFSLGMTELVSYWKAACSPLIKVSCHNLTAEDLGWWQQLFQMGLGEFYYQNQIDFTSPEHLRWEVQGQQLVPSVPSSKNPNGVAAHASAPDLKPDSGVLIPIGGGKDSAVTLELLAKHWQGRRVGLAVNPTTATLHGAHAGNLETLCVVIRDIDPVLLSLNQAGYLNGHTPFSAMVAWISCLVARLYQLPAIAVSNEQSSNEGNVMFHGIEVNHQYSKTLTFESSFQHYLASHTSNGPYYFSFLRPLYELQIAQLFSQHITIDNPVLTSFRSCNRGQRQGIWCCDCPKCLFAYSMLYPFYPAEVMQKIFGQDLFDKLSLKPYALELLGFAQTKPFECVGTFEESRIAWWLAWHHTSAQNRKAGALLSEIFDERLATIPEAELRAKAEEVFSNWSQNHALPKEYASLLQKALTDCALPQYLPSATNIARAKEAPHG